MSEAAVRTEIPSAGPLPDSPPAAHCHACGRRQTRVCFCGATLARTEALCPQCGVDWRKIRRERRPSRSGRGQRSKLIRNCVIGGALAIVVAGVLYMLLHTADASAGALSSAGSLLASAWSALTGHLAEIGLLALVFAVGAAGGAARYYIRRSRRHSGKRRRRKP